MPNELILKGEIRSFDVAKREVDVFVLPWEQDAETVRGLERFKRGSFDGIDPSRFVFRQRHQDPPTGRGIRLEEKDDGLYMGLKVSKTAAGEEQLTLLEDGVETGISVGFEDGKFLIERLDNGKKRIIHERVNEDGVLEVSTTYKPAFRQAAVLQIREQSTMSEPQEAEQAAAVTQTVATPIPQEFQNAIARLEKIDKLEEKLTAIMLNVPQAEAAAGQLVRQVRLNLRELADVITVGNEGVIPDALVSTMLGRIDTGRPFLNNTFRLQTPPAGVRLVMPKITQRPIVGLQESEKAELASQATAIGTVDFAMQTVGGAADLSLQLIKRSSPEFMGLWLDLLGDAYATDTENRAIDALLAETAVVEGGALDPAAPTLGGAFTNAASATGRTLTPDRIFLSTAAVAAFIDATEPAGGGGRPLYPGLAGISGLTNGGDSLPGGFTLRPVWVPELDDETPDIIVGPSRAFAWAEDGTYTLQADVPSKFGRDVGLAGMIWYAPLYPAAFTSYTLA